MKLLLSVISSNANLIRSFQTTLNEEGATIGRDADNTVVLVDPKRYISSHHAKLEYKAPDYVITDLSANGVLINEYTRPLGKGNSKKLCNGDQIYIGDGSLSVKYTISVKLIENTAPMSKTPIFDQEIENFNDPFADFNFDDPIQKIIDSNELIPSDWKNGQDLPDFPSLNGLSNSNANNHSSTAFDHVPVHKEAFQPFTEKKVEKSVPSASITNPTDIIPEDWWSTDKVGNTEEKVIDKDIQAISEPPPVTISEPVIPPSVTDVQNEFIQNFLRGAKLENSKFAEAINPQTFYIIGTMLRASIQGTRDVLEGRARIKNEMHLDLTLIKPKENNPIKFSVSTDEALIKLLTPADKAYLSPENAINEAFDDIRIHQYSVIAGMKSALFAVLKRFDPKILEERLQKQSPIAVSIPIHKQAKLWGLFEELYETLERESKDNFYHLFGWAFAETYSQLMNKLKKDNPH